MKSFIWPALDRCAAPVILRDVETDVPALLRHVPGRDVIVQAGGNVGVYPYALSRHFAQVFTVEPDPENHACLVENLAGIPNIAFRHAAFGECAGQADIDRMDPANVGAHRLALGGAGRVEVITIDSLDLPACDAIWLDVEGFEPWALRGAAATIEAFSPAIAIEDKGLEAHFGAGRGEAAAWLEARGYRQVDGFGRDRIFRRMS